MLNVKIFISALAFAISIAPLAANAKGADMLSHQQAQYMMITSASDQNVSRFPEGRAAERTSAQPGTTLLVAIPQSSATNVASYFATNVGG
jgi:hypothetical protein